MPTPYDTLRLDRPAPHVLLVTIDRPEASNAISTRLATEMVALFETLAMGGDELGGDELGGGSSDQDGDSGADVRAVVLTGAGDRAFCGGADLKERRGMTDEAWTRQHLWIERMARALLGCPVPVVAAVNGAAYGGGCEIVAACDFAYAAETARFALPETRLGILPGAGGTQTVARAVGERRAKEIILTGRPFSAAEAFEWGLVNRVLPAGDLLAETIAAAAAIAAGAPVAVRQAKSAIGRGLQMSLADGLAFEIEAYNRTVPTADRREGILAFNEKRPPAFRGR